MTNNIEKNNENIEKNNKNTEKNNKNIEFLTNGQIIPKYTEKITKQYFVPKILKNITKILTFLTKILKVIS